MEDLVWESEIRIWNGENHEVSQTFKKAMVEPGLKFKELTICHRTYSLQYNYQSLFYAFGMHDGEPMIIDTNGYTEPITKAFSSQQHAPGVDPYNVVSWFWSTRKGLDKTKNQWSFFRETSKQKMNANEWHHVCHVYSVSKRNTGFVFNGEILANRNQTETWATEDNYFSSRIFEPWQMVTWEDGNEYHR